MQSPLAKAFDLLPLRRASDRSETTPVSPSWPDGAFSQQSHQEEREWQLATRDRIRASDLVLLFVLSLLPRVTGLITFYNADESWGASVRVLTGDLSGGASQTLPLVNYLNAISFITLYAIGRLVGVWHGTADFRAQYFRDPTPFVFAGRLMAASLGAFTAVLAASIASRVGLTRRSSLVVAVMVALFPVNIWLSHRAKTDSGVAFGVLLVAWSLLRKWDAPESKRADIIIGLALALVMSFKQTAVFVVTPMLVGFLALLKWDRGLPWSQIGRTLVVMGASCVVAWIPMNLGVLLDLKSFFDWQRLALISVDTGAPVTAYHKLELAVLGIPRNVDGLTIAGAVAWLVAPLVLRKRKFLVLWASSAFAYVAINIASDGPTIHLRYYFPYHQLAFTLACIAVLSLVGNKGLSRPVGLLLAVGILACECAGSVSVVGQAMATPMTARLPEVIKAIADPERDKILAAAASQLGIPISAAAANEESNRHERLAKKYGVVLPQKPEEKSRRDDRIAGGYYVRSIPYSLGGDMARESSLSSRLKKVMPYWWPVQREEWDLDYWTSRGFTIYVLIDNAGFAESGNVLYDDPLYRPFHEQIEKRCDLVATLPTRRSLYGERTVRVYRVRQSGT